MIFKQDWDNGPFYDLCEYNILIIFFYWIEAGIWESKMTSGNFTAYFMNIRILKIEFIA